MKKIILVDGNNLLFRSFYATAYQGVIMKNSKGFPTNALYGFINMMNKIIKEENPSYIMVAFDKGKTFRHDKYESYKAGRAAMPDELLLQFPKAKELLDSMGIKHFEIYNYEADDIIGTLSKMIDNEDEFIGTIISSDKDLLQLISDEVTVKLLKQSGYIMMDKKEFYNTYKTEPIKMIDLKALMGDPSDHIPGVKGIGEKTAISLISKYGSLDGVYNNLDDISLKTREKLINDKENAYMSYDIATIYKDVDLGFDLEDCKYNGYKVEDFKKQLEDLEFYSLLKKIDFPSLENNTVSKKEDNNIDNKENSRERKSIVESNNSSKNINNLLDFYNPDYEFKERVKLKGNIKCPENIIKEMITTFTKKASSPVYFNEPISMCQKQCEKFFYLDLLNKASQCDDNKPLQMCYISAFIIGEIFTNINRFLKPFSPILGETFEYYINSKKFRYYAENVKHKPQITAFFGESPDWSY